MMCIEQFRAVHEKDAPTSIINCIAPVYRVTTGFDYGLSTIEAVLGTLEDKMDASEIIRYLTDILDCSLKKPSVLLNTEGCFIIKHGSHYILLLTVPEKLTPFSYYLFTAKVNGAFLSTAETKELLTHTEGYAIHFPLKC